MINTDHKPQIILVLGMHRSGTSLIAQLISKWGAFMGDELMPATEFNREGHWEYQPLVEFHEKMLEENVSSWYAPVNIPSTDELIKTYGEEARLLVAKMDQSGKDWCWKDPRMPIFLDFWQRILTGRQVNYVIVYRHPFRVASSLFKRDKFPAALSASLWELSSLIIFKHLSESKLYTILDYEKVINNPKEGCHQLFHFLDTVTHSTEKTAVSPNVLKTIRQSLNHEKTGIQFYINDFQQQIIENYQSGQIDKLINNSAFYMGKLHQILHLYKKQKNIEHLTQLFCEDESGNFKEKCSIIKKVEENDRVVAFKLSPSLTLRRLRIDPLNDYVLVRIDSVSLLHHGKSTGLQFNLKSNAIQVENQEYLFDTTDPQIILHIQNPENKVVDEVRIELEYLKTGRLVFPLLTELYNRRLIEREKMHTSEVNRLRNDFHQKIGQQKTKIYQLEKQLQSGRETIAELEEQSNHLERELTLIRNSRLLRLYKYSSLLLKPSGWKQISNNLKRKSKHAGEASLIRKSKYFDENYYLENNPDVENLKISPAKHYLLFGGFEGRDPSVEFSSAFYLYQNPDVLANRINPLIHYLKFGKREGRLPLPGKKSDPETETTDKATNAKKIHLFKKDKIKITPHKPHFAPPVNDFSLLIPFNYNVKKFKPGPSIAVICHLFYTDLLEEIKAYLENIPYHFDLFITTDTSEKEKQIAQMFTDWCDRQVEIKVVPNRGRDIAPKLLAWPEVYSKYEFFLHIHSKKTVQEKILSGWRKYLYETLLGNKNTVLCIFDVFNSDNTLGIIAPQHFASIRHAIGWGWNYHEARTFAQKLEIKIDPEGPVDFPSGSMFWGRTAALKPLLESGLSFSDFPEESGQIDNTLSHVIERLYFFVCEKSGFNWIKINSRFNKTSGERTLRVESRKNLIEMIPLVKGSLLQPEPRRQKGFFRKLSVKSTKTTSNQASEKTLPPTLPLHERLRYIKIHSRSPYAHLDLNEFIRQLKLHAGGRESIIDFDEDFYLKANPDVSGLIANGLYNCGFTHYLLAGKNENRLWSNHKITRIFDMYSNFPEGMAKPANIKNKYQIEPFEKPLKKSESPYLLILFGHLQKNLFYAGYRAFFKDFDIIFPMFDKIVLSVENQPIEPELATQYSERIKVIDQNKLYGIDDRPDLIISFSNHMFAKAKKLFGHPEKIIYYCQEYEAGFFPFGTEYIEAMKAVAQSHNLIISTIILHNYLKNKGLLMNSRVFVSSPEIETFDVKPVKNKKLFFYFRPEYFHTRNIPEMIWEAVYDFCHRHSGFEIYLVGTIDTRFSFDLHENTIFVLSKLPNPEYQKLISSCDVVISMIYSAHPGVVAFQATASGIPTVTNVFENRDAEYLREISKNIVPYDPLSDNLTDKIEDALELPKGQKSFRKLLYTGNEQTSLIDFILEILKQNGKNYGT